MTKNAKRKENPGSPLHDSSHGAQDTQLQQALGRSARDHAALWDVDATVHHGSVRPGHGIEVRLTASAGRARVYDGLVVPATIDMHGGIFAALPNGLGSMAQMLLPLVARLDGVKTEAGKWSGTIVLGAKKLSRGRLEATLAAIVSAGDPPFVFELRCSCPPSLSKGESEAELLGFLPTRASLLLHGLSHPAASVRDGATPGQTFRRSKLRIYAGWLRWWLLPFAFMAASWHLFLRPELLLPHIPLLPMLQNAIGDGQGQASVASILPPHPGSMAQAFQLGQIHGELMQPSSSSRTEALLRQAGFVLDEGGDIIITKAQLDGKRSIMLCGARHPLARSSGFNTGALPGTVTLRYAHRTAAIRGTCRSRGSCAGLLYLRQHDLVLCHNRHHHFNRAVYLPRAR